MGGYYQPFVRFIEHMIAEEFLPATHGHGIVIESDPARLIDGLAAFAPVTVPKWM